MEHGFHWPMVFIHGIGYFSSIKGGRGEWKRNAFWILFIWMGILMLPSLGDAPLDNSWAMAAFCI